jgi:hypothetical protein
MWQSIFIKFHLARLSSVLISRLLLQDENCEPSFIVRLELLRLVSRFIEMNDALFIYQSSHDSAHSMTIMPLPATAASSSSSSSQSTVVSAALTELAEFDVNVALQRLSIQAVESSSSSSSSSSALAFAFAPASSSSSSSSTSLSSSSAAMIDAGTSHVPDEHAQQLHHQFLRAPTEPMGAGHFYAPAFRLIRNLSMRTDAMVCVLGQNGDSALE